MSLISIPKPRPSFWVKRLASLVVIYLLVVMLPAFDQGIAAANRAQPLLLQKAAQTPDAQVSVIVQKTLRDDSIEQTVRGLGGYVTSDLPIINAFAAQLPARQVAMLGQTAGVRYVSLDAPVVQPSAAPCSGCVDTSVTTNAYNAAIGADQLWNHQVDGVWQPWLQGSGVGVVVLDSGIQSYQNDFTNVAGGQRLKANHKTNPNANIKNDQYGHGTHVAGIIGGTGKNSNGKYAGIAPDVNLLSVKVTDDQGASTVSDVLRGFQWVLQNKAAYNIRVVNISLNSSVYNSYNIDPLCAAVEVLWFSGIVVVVSAGNNGTATLFPPANDPFVITVGATDDKATPSISDDTVTSFSAYGRDELGNVKPDLVAPGRNIISVEASKNDTLARTHPNNRVPDGLVEYFSMSGTSMAAPMVSGSVALLLQSEPNLTPDQVKYRLKGTALQSSPRGAWDTRAGWASYSQTTSGAGYLDINAAVNQPNLLGPANTNLPVSQLLGPNASPTAWGSVSWSSVNWSSVNWSSVNWSSVNWTSVNWSSDYWGP